MAEMNFLIKSSVCTGCQLCELVCSLAKEKESNPAKSRIYTESYMMEGLRIPRVCVNCSHPACVDACPFEALRKDETTGIVVLDYEKCSHCGDCVEACPFGGLRMTPEGKLIKCDLCGGDPECVKVCETRAIQYVERVPQNLTRKRVGFKLPTEEVPV